MQQVRRLPCQHPAGEHRWHDTGPLHVQYYVPVTVPNTSAVGAGGCPVLIASGADTSFLAANPPTPVNLTVQRKTVPWLGPQVVAASSNTSSSGSGNCAADAREGMVYTTVPGVLLEGVVTLLLTWGADYVRRANGVGSLVRPGLSLGWRGWDLMSTVLLYQHENTFIQRLAGIIE
ncbi:hypothetical protein H4582DRAFT_1212391 [Lactarius indigo]|nr:hypothetical protein H4582DRAFT_1212391 [Lactarius indigo]